MGTSVSPCHKVGAVGDQQHRHLRGGGGRQGVVAQIEIESKIEATLKAAYHNLVSSAKVQARST